MASAPWAQQAPELFEPVQPLERPQQAPFQRGLQVEQELPRQALRAAERIGKPQEAPLRVLQLLLGLTGLREPPGLAARLRLGQPEEPGGDYPEYWEW